MTSTQTPPVPSAQRRGSRLAWAVGGVALLCALALGAFVAAGQVLLMSMLSEDEQAAWRALTSDRWPVLLLPGVALVGAAAAVAAALYRRLVAAPAQLAEQARVLLTTAGGRTAAGTSWPTELRALALSLEALAAQREQLRADVAQEVARASRAIDLERNRLAALMSELTQGVVVCNLDGRILLYNTRARLQFRLLQAASPSSSLPLGGADLIGLGRSIYATLDRERLTQALQSLQARLQRGAEHPTADFVSPAPGGHLLRVQMAPVRAVEEAADVSPSTRLPGQAAPPLTGFVLMLQTQPVATTDPQALEAEDDPEDHGPHAGEVIDPTDSRPVFYDFDLFAHRDTGQALEDRPLAALSFTIFDTETTGLDPAGGDEILQIGAVRMVNGKLLRGERFDQLVDPRRSIPSASIPIHGITPDMVQGQPTIQQVLPAFHRYAHDTVLVAHNAAFDMRFLQLKESATGLRFDQPVLDTLLLSAVLHPQQDSHRLEAIAERLGVRVVGRHTALGDALVTAEVFQKLVPLLADRGIHTLGQALAASRQSGYASLSY
jgi:DNA polymerase III subunit epsilon